MAGESLPVILESVALGPFITGRGRGLDPDGFEIADCASEWVKEDITEAAAALFGTGAWLKEEMLVFAGSGGLGIDANESIGETVLGAAFHRGKKSATRAYMCAITHHQPSHCSQPGYSGRCPPLAEASPRKQSPHLRYQQQPIHLQQKLEKPWNV